MILVTASGPEYLQRVMRNWNSMNGGIEALQLHWSCDQG